MALEFMRKKSEDIVDYMIRLYDNRAKYDLSNQEVADLLNREDETEYDESRWRKLYQGYKNFFEPWVTKNFANSDDYNQNILDKYTLAQAETKKANMRLADVNREYNKMLRSSARFENLAEKLIEGVQQITPPLDSMHSISESQDKELLVLLNDIHLGMKIDNRFNKYNVEIAKDRLKQVKERVYKTVKKEEIELLHIANLGDAIHGTIHASAKLQSEEDAIQQIINASELLIDFIKTFLDLGVHVNYYNIVGNHGRLSKKGEEVSAEENFEKLILTILDASLSKYTNYTSEGCQDGFIETHIAGQEVILTHGNFDNHNNSAYRLPQLLGYLPNLICSGHVHHMLQKDFGTTLIEVSPSLSGLDEYATSGRFAGKAGQKMILFEDKEISYTSTIYVV